MGLHTAQQILAAAAATRTQQKNEAAAAAAIMSLQRAVVSLLTRRFWPRVARRTAPARFLQSSLKGLAIGDRATVVAAAALAGGGTFAAIQYFRKGTNDVESAAGRKPNKITTEEDMKVMFEDWMKKYNRTYRDEKEKAMRFQVFKDTYDWAKSRPPSLQKKLIPLNCFADFKPEELPSGRSSQCCIIDIDGPDTEEYLQTKFLAENENGEEFVWK